MSLQLAGRRFGEILSFMFSGTSAEGAMIGQTYNWPIGVSDTLAVTGTTSEEGWLGWEHILVSQEQTNSGIQVQELQSPSVALMELRRLSGLSWDQLARLFGITRRSLHFWVSGKPLTPAHEERLNRLLATMRHLDRGSASENRSLLLSVRKDGVIPFDLLVSEQYEEVLSLLAPGQAPTRLKPSALSVEARQARAPLAPDELVGALQDRVHKEMGKVRVPRVGRSRK